MEGEEEVAWGDAGDEFEEDALVFEGDGAAEGDDAFECLLSLGCFAVGVGDHAAHAFAYPEDLGGVSGVIVVPVSDGLDDGRHVFVDVVVDAPAVHRGVLVGVVGGCAVAAEFWDPDVVGWCGVGEVGGEAVVVPVWCIGVAEVDAVFVGGESVADDDGWLVGGDVGGSVVVEAEAPAVGGGGVFDGSVDWAWMIRHVVVLILG